MQTGDGINRSTPSTTNIWRLFLCLYVFLSFFYCPLLHYFQNFLFRYCISFSYSCFTWAEGPLRTASKPSQDRDRAAYTLPSSDPTCGLHRVLLLSLFSALYKINIFHLFHFFWERTQDRRYKMCLQVSGLVNIDLRASSTFEIVNAGLQFSVRMSKLTLPEGSTLQWYMRVLNTTCKSLRSEQKEKGRKNWFPPKSADKQKL